MIYTTIVIGDPYPNLWGYTGSLGNTSADEKIQEKHHLEFGGI
jgi:hypothetical protein